MIKEILNGKSLGRIIMNKYCKKYFVELSGTVIDLGGGDNASYNSFFGKKAIVTTTDYDDKNHPDLVVDLNKKLKFGDESFDNAILLNTIYILEDPVFSLKEIYRILKPGGKFFITFPFIFNEAPEPFDYWRFTSQGIDRLLDQSSFKIIEKHKIGERFSSAFSLINPFRKLKFLNFIFYPLALLLDYLLPNKIKNQHPAPMSYFVICVK